jgi:hypothetical protein
MTGRMLEESFLMPIEVTWNGYMKYRESFQWCLKHQPTGWDPTDPPTRASSDLYSEVALAMEEVIGDFNWEELRFYTALRSPLDEKHGVDGWFEFRGRVVTVDITENRAKEFGYKADVILFYEDNDYDTNLHLRGSDQVANHLIGAA